MLLAASHVRLHVAKPINDMTGLDWHVLKCQHCIRARGWQLPSDSATMQHQ